MTFLSRYTDLHHRLNLKISFAKLVILYGACVLSDGCLFCATFFRLAEQFLTCQKNVSISWCGVTASEWQLELSSRILSSVGLVTENCPSFSKTNRVGEYLVQ